LNEVKKTTAAIAIKNYCTRHSGRTVDNHHSPLQYFYNAVLEGLN